MSSIVNDKDSLKRNAQPFVKWAGGKRQLLGEISARMPESFDGYFEPFVGGGALLLDLQPRKAVINDINSSLVNAYRQIQTHPEEVISALEILDAGQGDDAKNYYYQQRGIYNEMLANDEYSVQSAAMLIYINKHCFNGLYRVNSKGRFNVPHNGSSAVSCSPKNIRAVSNCLSDVVILNGDFETACANATKGDFVFFDSPYAPLNPTSFESYTKEGFSHDEHVRLARLFKQLSECGWKGRTIF